MNPSLQPDFTDAYYRLLLQSFCGVHCSPRLFYALPFVHNGWTYATDGKAAIRVSGAYSLDVDTSGIEAARFPPPFGAQAVFDKYCNWFNSATSFGVLPTARLTGKIDDDLTFYWEHKRLPIGDVEVDAELFAKFATIPGVEYCCTGQDSPVLFRFHRGEGMLMPMSKEQE